jgi:hypothetical protein
VRPTGQSSILTTITLAAAGLVLAACGPDRGESEAPNTEDDRATHATAPTETMPATPAIPTNASVQAYCAAAGGKGIDFSGQTVREAVDAFTEFVNRQRKTGTPSEMPADVRTSYLEYLNKADGYIADLRNLDADGPISQMQTDPEFRSKWGNGIQAPPEVARFFTETCEGP